MLVTTTMQECLVVSEGRYFILLVSQVFIFLSLTFRDQLTSYANIVSYFNLLKQLVKITCSLLYLVASYFFSEDHTQLLCLQQLFHLPANLICDFLCSGINSRIIDSLTFLSFTHFNIVLSKLQDFCHLLPLLDATFPIYQSLDPEA